LPREDQRRLPHGRPLVEALERIAEVENHLRPAIRQDRLRRLC
jgi:hypothetical protein